MKIPVSLRVICVVALNANVHLAFYQKCGFEKKENEMVRIVFDAIKILSLTTLHAGQIRARSRSKALGSQMMGGLDVINLQYLYLYLHIK